MTRQLSSRTGGRGLQKEIRWKGAMKAEKHWCKIGTRCLLLAKNVFQFTLLLYSTKGFVFGECHCPTLSALKL